MKKFFCHMLYKTSKLITLLIFMSLTSGCSPSKDQQKISAVTGVSEKKNHSSEIISKNKDKEEDWDIELEGEDWENQDILGGIDYSKRDPFEKLNRFLFNVHTGFDELLLKPAAGVYKKAIPDQGKDMISNFLSNLWEPFRLVGCILALDFKSAAITSSRLMINTTIGFAGMFDVAKDWKNIEKIKMSGDVILSRYGIPEGPYIFIPFLGPSSVRSSVGYVADIFLDPFVYLIRDRYNYSRATVGYIHEREKFLDITNSIDKISADRYAATRVLYMQSKEKNN